MSGATTCPGCGKRVSAYAAGCADCGADLDAHRRALAAGTATAAKRRRRLPRLPEGGGGPSLNRGELLWLALTLFFVPFVHLMGVLLGGLGAYDRWHAGRQTAFAVFALAAVVAAGLEVADLL